MSSFTKKHVTKLSTKRVYDGFFKVDEYTFDHALFAGGKNHQVCREILERGDAVAVLPYDPKTDSVVLIEQIRIGAYRTSGTPWLYEVVAGMIDSELSKEQTAIKEVQEEANLEVSELYPMLNYLSSPGGLSERVYLYLALVDCTGAGGVYGLDSEQEDIKVHVVPFKEAMNWVNEGKIDNSASVIALQWLALNKDTLVKQKIIKDVNE